MKIKSKHYQALQKSMSEALKKLKNKNIDNIDDLINYYTKDFIGRCPKTRALWDLFHNSTIEGLSCNQYTCKVLYPYLNDNDIKVAIFSIAKNL